MLPPRQHQLRRVHDDGSTPLLANKETSIGHAGSTRRFSNSFAPLHSMDDKENKVNITTSKFHDRQGFFNRKYKYCGLKENNGCEEDEYDCFLKKNTRKEDREGSVSMVTMSEWTFGSALQNKNEILSYQNPSTRMADDGTIGIFDDVSAIYSYDIGCGATDAPISISPTNNMNDSFDPSTIYSVQTDVYGSSNQDRRDRLGRHQEGPPSSPSGVIPSPRPNTMKQAMVDDHRLAPETALSECDSHITTANRRIVIIGLDDTLLADSPSSAANMATNRGTRRFVKNMKSVLGALGCLGRVTNQPFVWSTPLLSLQNRRHGLFRVKRRCEV